MTLELISSKLCLGCKQLKQLMKKAGIEFEEVDVSTLSMGDIAEILTDIRMSGYVAAPDLELPVIRNSSTGDVIPASVLMSHYSDEQLLDMIRGIK